LRSIEVESRHSASPHASVVNTLFAANRGRLFDTAIRILRCPQRAEDVVHDAYIKFAELETDSKMRRPIAYLHQVVRNLAIDRYRRTIMEKYRFTAEEHGENVAEPSGVPEDVVENRELLRLISRALAGLPARTQRAFELHRLGGLTQREVAAELGVSPTLVNFMIKDALVRCRSVVGSETYRRGTRPCRSRSAAECREVA
jgi:RNA polymerase sigma-70 factor (ECF subfamily)